MKKITFKEYFATLFGGLWQAILWVAGLFGYKDDSMFGKTVKRIFASCVTILLVMITCGLVYGFAAGVVCDKWVRIYKFKNTWQTRYISSDIAFQTSYFRDKGRIYDKKNDRVMMRNVDWVVTSDDSLAVFSKNGRRGYINRFTGDVAVPRVFTRAWIFSEGLAAVEKEGKLLFIDHSGNVVIDRNLQVGVNPPAYTFKNGYCVMTNPDNEKRGLIDKTGNWVLDAEYDYVFNNEGFWQVEKERRIGLYTADLDSMFPVENSAIYVNDSIIEVRHADTHIAKRYDLAGNIITDFMIDAISNLKYATTELNDGCQSYENDYIDNQIYGIANCQRYFVDGGRYYYGYYGLISRDGKIITPPIYTGIEAISKNLYLCQPDGVIINDKGEIVK